MGLLAAQQPSLTPGWFIYIYIYIYIYRLIAQHSATLEVVTISTITFWEEMRCLAYDVVNQPLLLLGVSVLMPRCEKFFRGSLSVGGCWCWH